MAAFVQSALNAIKNNSKIKKVCYSKGGDFHEREYIGSGPVAY